MASFFRLRIAQKVLSTFQGVSELQEQCVASLVNVYQTKIRIQQPQFLLPVRKLANTIMLDSNSSLDAPSILTCMRNQGLPTAEGIIDIGLEENAQCFVFTFDKHVFNRIILLDICVNLGKISKRSYVLKNIPEQRKVFNFQVPPMGRTLSLSNFREYTRMNFYANICAFVGQKVTKINILGDWGPLCALLLSGYQNHGIDDELEKSPSIHLSHVLRASLTKFSNEDQFQKVSKQCFEKMESGDNQILLLWSKIRTTWIKEIKFSFHKMGIIFDEFFCKSDNYENVNKICDDLSANRIAITDESEKQNITIKLDDESFDLSYKLSEGFSPIHNIATEISDAVTLKKKIDFDSMYYVSDHKQDISRKVISKILENMRFEWSKSLEQLIVPKLRCFDGKMGRQVSFDEAFNKIKTAILKQLKMNITLELGEDADDVADKLALAGLIFADMKHKSKREYDFNWDDVLSFDENSGITFQFYNAALLQMQADSDIAIKFDIDLSPLSESVALNLIVHLARFDEIILNSYISKEPFLLCQYINSLCYFIKRATDTLKLDKKEERYRTIKARLLLFFAAQKVLEKSLKLLGIDPLSKLEKNQ